MSMVFDTPESIAFVRACARQAALKLGKPGMLGIIKEVYGFAGSKRAVIGLLDDYIEGILAVRKWAPEYAERIKGIAQFAIDRADEEGAGIRLQQVADSNVQMLFDLGDITEQEGNDACMLIYIEVVRARAGSR